VRSRRGLASWEYACIKCLLCPPLPGLSVLLLPWPVPLGSWGGSAQMYIFLGSGGDHFILASLGHGRLTPSVFEHDLYRVLLLVGLYVLLCCPCRWWHFLHQWDHRIWCSSLSRRRLVSCWGQRTSWLVHRVLCWWWMPPSTGPSLYWGLHCTPTQYRTQWRGCILEVSRSTGEWGAVGSSFWQSRCLLVSSPVLGVVCHSFSL